MKHHCEYGFNHGAKCSVCINTVNVFSAQYDDYGEVFAGILQNPDDISWFHLFEKFVRFYEIVDLLVPKIKQNSSKMAEKITVFRNMKKAHGPKLPHFHNTSFAFAYTPM